jgi:hypothetical protein
MTCENCRRDAVNQLRNMDLAYTLNGGELMEELEPGKGHDGCKGCTCQHLPVGSVEFLGGNPSRSA